MYYVRELIIIHQIENIVLFYQKCMRLKMLDTPCIGSMAVIIHHHWDIAVAIKILSFDQIMYNAYILSLLYNIMLWIGALLATHRWTLRITNKRIGVLFFLHKQNNLFSHYGKKGVDMNDYEKWWMKSVVTGFFFVLSTE